VDCSPELLARFPRGCTELPRRPGTGNVSHQHLVPPTAARPEQGERKMFDRPHLSDIEHPMQHAQPDGPIPEAVTREYRRGRSAGFAERDKLLADILDYLITKDGKAMYWAQQHELVQRINALGIHLKLREGGER
jgi:hypothetical protein